MSAEHEKVHSMDKYKKDGDETNALAEEIMAKSAKDFGKAALFISILAVVLLAVVFFGLNQNVTGLRAEVAELTALKGQVAGMDARMGTMDQKLGALEGLPETMKKMVASQALSEMSYKLDAMGGQLTPAQAEILRQAKALVDEVQTSLK